MVSPEKRTPAGKRPVAGGDGRSPLRLPQLYDLLYGGAVETKYAVAVRLFRLYGDGLSRQPRIAAGLSALVEEQALLARQMLTMNMDRTCARCAGNPGGGCCSMAIAAETDAVQLLVNMLAGIAVVLGPTDGADCCYLGPNGCPFLFKPVFCLNYLCSRITACASPPELRVLGRLTGNLLRAQHDLEQQLIDFFGRQPQIGSR